MTLSRDELERELVLYDKQKLITQCLKLFDSNQMLVERIENQSAKIREMDEMVEGLVERNRDLKARSWWDMLKTKLFKLFK